MNPEAVPVPEPREIEVSVVMPSAPRLITSFQFRRDDVGFVTDRRSQVFVVALPDDGGDDTAAPASPVQVTTGDADCTDVAWSPDGTELAFVSARHERADRDLVTDVYAVRPDGTAVGTTEASGAVRSSQARAAASAAGSVRRSLSNRRRASGDSEPKTYSAARRSSSSGRS